MVVNRENDVALCNVLVFPSLGFEIRQTVPKSLMFYSGYARRWAFKTSNDQAHRRQWSAAELLSGGGRLEALVRPSTAILRLRPKHLG